MKFANYRKILDINFKPVVGRKITTEKSKKRRKKKIFLIRPIKSTNNS